MFSYPLPVLPSWHTRASLMAPGVCDQHFGMFQCVSKCSKNACMIHRSIPLVEQSRLVVFLMYFQQLQMILDEIPYIRTGKSAKIIPSIFT